MKDGLQRPCPRGVSPGKQVVCRGTRGSGWGEVSTHSCRPMVRYSATSYATCAIVVMSSSPLQTRAAVDHVDVECTSAHERTIKDCIPAMGSTSKRTRAAT